MDSTDGSDRRIINNLCAKMSNPEVFNDLVSCRSVLSKAMTLSACNANLTPLLLSTVKLLAHSDMCIKKTASHILCKYGDSDPEMVLLAINTLIKDSQDSNPMVRGIALKTLCSLRHESILEFTDSAIERGLSDKSAYVRRAAVLGCVKVFQFSHGSTHHSSIIDKLYAIIRDKDPIVVVNGLSALEEILHDEGGIVINKNIAHHVLNQLNDVPTWSQISALTLLKKYTPTSDDEVFDVLNILDPFLKHSSCSVICATLALFLHLLKDMPQLQSEVCRRAKEAVITLIGSVNVELTYAVLEFLSSLHHDNVQVFSSNYLSFFCKHKDPQYLKTKKMELLFELLDKDNEQAILDEFCLHCSDGSRVVSQCAVDNVARVAQSHKHLSQHCLDKFKVLLESSSGHVVSNVLQVLQSLPLQDLEDDIVSVLGKIAGTVSDDAGMMAVLHLLGNHGHSVEDVPYILEDFVERLEDIDSASIREQLLTTVIKVFFCRPAEMQTMMGVLFEVCVNDSDRRVRDTAEFYFRLLQMDVDFAQTVLCGSSSHCDQ